MHVVTMHLLLLSRQPKEKRTMSRHIQRAARSKGLDPLFRGAFVQTAKKIKRAPKVPAVAAVPAVPAPTIPATVPTLV
jgi:hypothetical protein